MSKIIMGIQLNERNEHAPELQQLLTKYGCSITTRIGLHTASATACSPHGLILLDCLEDADEEIANLEKDLTKLETVTVKKMVF